MESFVKAVADYIEDNDIATFGTDMFSPRWPSTAPDKCMLIIPTGGISGKEIPVRNVSIQFLFRSENYPAAEALAYQVYHLFHARVENDGWVSPHNYSMDSYYVYVSKAVQEPYSIGVDQNNRNEITLNVNFKIRERSVENNG